MSFRSLVAQFVVFSFVGCASSPSTTPSFVRSESIEISKNALEWNRAFDKTVKEHRLRATYPHSGFAECRETKEIPDTFLCLFNSQEEMGYALSRASCFIEGSFCGHPKGTVVGFSDPGFRAAILQINGYDLKGSDLLRFHKAALKKCEEVKEPDFCLNHYENRAFQDFIIPMATQSPGSVLITFARFSAQPWNQTLVHEIMHAQYFQDKKYSEVVDRFWKNELTETDRENIRKALSKAYDPKDEHLMINEFQAYILQTDAQAPAALLRDFVPRYRSRMMKKMSEAGIRPIEIQLPSATK